MDRTYRRIEDPSIVNLINEKLIEKIQHSIQKLCLEGDRARPQKSGDSDIMFTSIEGDEFDQDEYGGNLWLASSWYLLLDFY